MPYDLIDQPIPVRLPPRRTMIVGLLAAICLGAGAASVPAADAPLSGLPIPAQTSPGTTLAIGDPQTQQAIVLSGAESQLPFKPQWANLSGGPQTSEAFRAKALDIGSVADIPPIFATWTNLDTKIVAAKFRQDPINHPTYQLGIAPKVKVESLADLRGKKIAYSPGQAQGVLILRVLQKAGLSKTDVKLVELPSTGDVYPNALASGLVDVAPIANANISHYLAKYQRDGAKVIPHGLRDDPAFLYAPTAVLRDPAKSAAIRDYVKAWAKAWVWQDTHPAEWTKGYFVGNQGLTQADAEYLDKAAGISDIPSNWDDVIKRQQATIDLMAKELNKPRFEAADEFDRRFETVAASAIVASR